MLNEVFEIIDDIQMTDNTWQEAEAANRELKERIKDLFVSKSGWVPMESAPKDGSDFVAITDYGKACVMKWNGEEFVRSVTCRRCSGFGLGGLTHWGALPGPPNKAMNSDKKERGQISML